MKMNWDSKSKTLLFLFSIFSLALKGQSIYNSWFSEKHNLCLKIDSSSKCVTINEFYDAEDCNRIKFKKKDNKLRIIWSINQRLFFWEKEIYLFNIDKLSQDTLIITRQPDNHFMLDEAGQSKESTIVFIACPLGCSNKLKGRKED